VAQGSGAGLIANCNCGLQYGGKGRLSRLDCGHSYKPQQSTVRTQSGHSPRWVPMAAMGSEAVMETARAHGKYFILNLRDPTVRKRPRFSRSGRRRQNSHRMELGKPPPQTGDGSDRGSGAGVGFAQPASATASAPAARRIGHDGSVAARHTASATSDDCVLGASGCCIWATTP